MDLQLMLSIATILGGITAVWFIGEKISNAIRAQKVFFPDCSDKFYEHYAKALSNAKKEIWITSDGFNMRNPISKEFAVIMARAIRDALSRGVQVNRLQITHTMHLNWIHELKKLKKDFPDNFKVWVNIPLPSIPNVCAIDPESGSCVSERMQHRVGVFGQGSVAHTFNFTHGDKKMAQQTKQIVVEAIEHPASQELSLEDLDTLYSNLMNSRLIELETWRSTHREVQDIDLSASGVFDEAVISKFLQTQVQD